MKGNKIGNNTFILDFPSGQMVSTSTDKFAEIDEMEILKKFFEQSIQQQTQQQNQVLQQQQMLQQKPQTQEMVSPVVFYHDYIGSEDQKLIQFESVFHNIGNTIKSINENHQYNSKIIGVVSNIRHIIKTNRICSIIKQILITSFNLLDNATGIDDSMNYDIQKLCNDNTRRQYGDVLKCSTLVDILHKIDDRQYTIIPYDAVDIIEHDIESAVEVSLAVSARVYTLLLDDINSENDIYNLNRIIIPFSEELMKAFATLHHEFKTYALENN